MDGFVCGEMVSGGAAFHRFRKDHVTVVVVDDKDVSMTVTGWEDEFSGGVGCNFTSDGFAGGEDVMRSDGGVWNVGRGDCGDEGVRVDE